LKELSRHLGRRLPKAEKVLTYFHRFDYNRGLNPNPKPSTIRILHYENEIHFSISIP
jgi:hypothetical protein